jgi:cytoskeletal protein CcmA (bactofilin family)
MGAKENIMTKKKDTTINTIIGEDAIVNGNIQLNGNIIIYGQINGDVSTDGAITLSTTAKINGNLNGEELNIGGTVEGDVTSKGKIILGDQANLKGNISAAQVVIEDGAKFEGSCLMCQDN